MIEHRLGGLVHASVSDSATRMRHERFIVTHLVIGLVTAALLPPYLVQRGVPSPAELVSLVCMMVPVLAAGILSLTGWLNFAQTLTSLALAVLIGAIATASGGLQSGTFIWLAVIPIEAMFSGSYRATVTAAGIAILAAVGIAVADEIRLVPGGESWPLLFAVPILAIIAIGHAVAFAIERSRLERNSRATLARREAQERSLLQAIDDLVTWHDRNGQVHEASAASGKLLGVQPSMLHGTGLLTRVHVSDRPAFLQAISDAAMSERPVVVQFRLHVDAAAAAEANGGLGPKVFWAEMRAHRIDPAAAGQGEATVVAVTRDISLHIRHTEDLERARRAAELADASKGHFLATVSHELRTPLNAIIGFSEILCESSGVSLSDARRREYAQIVHESGQHLLEVVNTLLDMSKIESGNFDFQPDAFDAAQLVHSCCDLMQLRADQAGILFAREIARDLPELVADARACRQVAINLLSNAIKFTPRGGRIDVRLAREYDRIVLQVSDTGIGIAEEDLPRLGDPFFQAGQSYTRSHEGSGLGLSVVRGLVGLHEGEVALESAPGQGTTVSVFLPIDCRTGRARSAEPIRVRTTARRAPAAALIAKAG